jgi:hypothetical protein
VTYNHHPQQKQRARRLLGGCSGPSIAIANSTRLPDVMRVSHEHASSRVDAASARRKTPEQRASDQARAAAPGAERPARAAPHERRPGGAERGPKATRPWHNAKHVSRELLDASADTRVTRRHVRYAQRQVLWGESTIERVRKCGRTPVSDGNVLVRSNGGVSHYTGLATCGSIWACPCCSAKIRNRRAEEISEATAGWDRRRNEVYMATFTAPHDLGMPLRPLLGTIADGFRTVISGRAWIKIRKRLGIAGTIRSMEITHGRSGWHPHLHVLIYVEGQLDAKGLADLVLYLRDRWGSFIIKSGYRPPHQDHGVDVQRCVAAADAGKYVAKTQDGRSVGNEVARGDLKQGRQGGRTPIEVLDDFRWTGDAGDLRLWHEYERATKGRQCITWSKGLRRILEVDDEQTDEEIAAEEIGGEDIALIPGKIWRSITWIPGMPAAILDACEKAGFDGINDLLRRYGLRLAEPPPTMIGGKA